MSDAHVPFASVPAPYWSPPQQGHAQRSVFPQARQHWKDMHFGDEHIP